MFYDKMCLSMSQSSMKLLLLVVVLGGFFSCTHAVPFRRTKTLLASSSAPLKIEPNDAFKQNADWWKDPLALFGDDDDDNVPAVGNKNTAPPRTSSLAPPKAEKATQRFENPQANINNNNNNGNSFRTRSKIPNKAVPKNTMEEKLSSFKSEPDMETVVDALQDATPATSYPLATRTSDSTVGKQLIQHIREGLQTPWGKRVLLVWSAGKVALVVWIVIPRAWHFCQKQMLQARKNRDASDTTKTSTESRDKKGSKDANKTKTGKSIVIQDDDIEETLTVSSNTPSFKDQERYTPSPPYEEDDEYDLDESDDESQTTATTTTSTVTVSVDDTESYKSNASSSPSNGWMTGVRSKWTRKEADAEPDIPPKEDQSQIQQQLLDWQRRYQEAEAERAHMEREYEKASMQLQETTATLTSLQSTTRYLQAQLHENEAMLQRVVQAERSKAKEELLRMKEAMIKVRATLIHYT
jgi:hypothetical protein